MQWYYASGSEQVGPVSESELLNLVDKGTIDTDTLVWNSSMTDWTKYGDLETPPTRNTSELASSPETPAPTCSQCGKKVSRDDMIQYKNNWVCASCKPIFVKNISTIFII